MKHQKWKKISKKTAYKGWVHIVEHEVGLPDGRKIHYEVDSSLPLGGTACMIKTLDEKLIFTYQYRFPIDKWIYDLPGGVVDPGETSEEAAIRECQEEVGIKPNKIIHLISYPVNPSRSDWTQSVFFCDEYEESRLEGSDFEYVETCKIPISVVQGMIDKGEIVDPPFIIGWYTAKQKGLV